MTSLVFIDGDQGTTGLQVREWLADRTDLRLLQLPADQRKARRTAPRRSTTATSPCCACRTRLRARPWRWCAGPACA